MDYRPMKCHMTYTPHNQDHRETFRIAYETWCCKCKPGNGWLRDPVYKSKYYDEHGARALYHEHSHISRSVWVDHPQAVKNFGRAFYRKVWDPCAEHQRNTTHMPKMLKTYEKAWEDFIQVMVEKSALESKEFGLKDNTTATIFEEMTSLLTENLQTFKEQLNYSLPGTYHRDQDAKGKHAFEEAHRTHWQYRMFLHNIFYSDQDEDTRNQQAYARMLSSLHDLAIDYEWHHHPEHFKPTPAIPSDVPALP